MKKWGQAPRVGVILSVVRMGGGASPHFFTSSERKATLGVLSRSERRRWRPSCEHGTVPFGRTDTDLKREAGHRDHQTVPGGERSWRRVKYSPLEAYSVIEVKGYGRQKSYLDEYAGSEYSLAFLPKVQITLWVDALRVEEVIRTIVEVSRTGRMGDGKIFVLSTGVHEDSGEEEIDF